MTDASDMAAGAVLKQKEPDRRKPLSFFSKVFSGEVRNYSAFDRKLMAIFKLV